MSPLYGQIELLYCIDSEMMVNLRHLFLPVLDIFMLMLRTLTFLAPRARSNCYSESMTPVKKTVGGPKSNVGSCVY